MAKGKKSKSEGKVSQGTGRGAKPVKLTPLQLILMGKGQYAAWRPEGAPKAKRR